MATYTIIISSKGQITLPGELREKFHLLEGEEAILVPVEEGILIKHKKVVLRGSWAGKIDSQQIEKEIKKLRKEWTL